MNTAITTLLVDDEPLARDGVRLRLSQHDGFQVVGECGNGVEAVEAVSRLRPDVLFLDVQMPGLTGFDVLDELDEETLPTVVFVTAYDQYALRAFEVHALDYLLKPFDEDRFAETMRRVRVRVAERRNGRLSDRIAGLLGDIREGDGGDRRGYPDRLVVKDAMKIAFVPVAELDWVEAEGDYMRLHCRGGRSHLIRRTMAEMERRLDPSRFVRIHRSTLVAIDRIQELRPTFHGEYAVLLHDGTRLKLSRGYRSRLQGLLEEPL